MPANIRQPAQLIWFSDIFYFLNIDISGNQNSRNFVLLRSKKCFKEEADANIYLSVKVTIFLHLCYLLNIIYIDPGKHAKSCKPITISTITTKCYVIWSCFTYFDRIKVYTEHKSGVCILPTQCLRLGKIYRGTGPKRYSGNLPEGFFQTESLSWLVFVML